MNIAYICCSDTQALTDEVDGSFTPPMLIPIFKAFSGNFSLFMDIQN